MGINQISQNLRHFLWIKRDDIPLDCEVYYRKHNPKEFQTYPSLQLKYIVNENFKSYKLCASFMNVSICVLARGTIIFVVPETQAY